MGVFFCCFGFVRPTLCVTLESNTVTKPLFILFSHLSSPSLSPSAQVQLAQAVLRPKGSAVAGLPAVGGLQLRPGDLRGCGGAAADAGAAHRH